MDHCHTTASRAHRATGLTGLVLVLLCLATACQSAGDDPGLSDGPGMGGDGDGAGNGNGNGDGDADADADGSPGDGDGETTPGAGDGDGDRAAGDGDTPQGPPPGWFADNSAAHRVNLPLAQFGANLSAEQLMVQLAGYDPGSLLRCAVADDPRYRTAIDSLGGTSWGYSVHALEDLSKPRFQAGLQKQQLWDLAPAVGNTDAPGPAPEIVKPDIVAVTADAALFYSRSHGLMLVDLTGGEPKFSCATPLPGAVDQFFFHDGHLVAMTRRHGQYGQRGGSVLLHFDVDATTIGFVETVELGQVSILDSRRFDDKLVFYTDLTLMQPGQAQTQQWDPGQGIAPAPVYQPANNHRSLRVYTLGERLTEELHDSLIDTSVSEDQLVHQQVSATTPIGSVIHEARYFGSNMWASDRYFAVTESITTTRLASWQTRNYSVCAEGHTVESTYTHCTTQYETRPNPAYEPPDNSSGDRACIGITLSDCLREVARVANETIQVPVGRECVERPVSRWVCDRRETRMTQYPSFSYDSTTRIYIYQYQPTGFVRLDTTVREITTTGLSALEFSDTVPVLTTSTETFDLAVPGRVQTLHFQNGILYVISEGVLQVYTIDGSSAVRTATLPVVNDSLQASLFSGDKLYLSDFGWQNGHDRSVLRVVDLHNPAFPRIEGATHSLPGGHRSILASDHGILTIGQVARFEQASINAIKLGLFSDPYVAEQAYLILATELESTFLHEPESQFFSAPGQRLLLPYWGNDQTNSQTEYRVSVSRIIPGEIVSEGAVVLPELTQRVRPVDGAHGSYLAFADSSIAWLRPDGAEWQSTAVLSYFKPFAVLRLNNQDDYAEVQRLGDQCKVFLSNAKDINQRAGGVLSAPFDCGRAGGVLAYDHTLLLGQHAVAFDDQGQITPVGDAEQAEIRERIRARPTCLLTMDLLEVVTLDYTKDYDEDDFTCVSPEELQRLTTEANGF